MIGNSSEMSQLNCATVIVATGAGCTRAAAAAEPAPRSSAAPAVATAPRTRPTRMRRPYHRSLIP
jgi:hypothetical protein